MHTNDDDAELEHIILKAKLKRLDTYGNPIKKGSKTHRIVFADNKMTNRPLSKVHIVESYKSENKIDPKYNIINRRCLKQAAVPERDEYDDIPVYEPNEMCKCSIF